MKIVRTVKDLRAQVALWRAQHHSISLIPTMGALHEGHLSLVAVGKKAAHKAVATLFVNPTQFGEGEDLATYPRDEDRDARMLAGAGCDLLFIPSVEEMYPSDFSTEVRVKGLTDCLCGAARPGHMDGVAQVVSKLLNQAGANYAVFGEKDWQQLAVIRRMARDLNIPTDILGGPTQRETDGLAMSSRNRYLNPDQRRIAGGLNRELFAAAARIAGGAPVDAECIVTAKILEKSGFDSVDYVEARDPETLQPVTVHDPARPGRLFAAAHLGKARLIDNVTIAPLS
ncbi:MAG: pantoate--beta-alanine ligase [Pseudomonadota bacterium]